MAEKVVIPIDIQIKNLNAAESIGALKDGIKELTKELEKLPKGSQEFKNTAAAIGNAKDKLADLNEQVVQTTTKAGKFQAVTGVLGQMANGFALAQSTMAMFGSESEFVTKSLEKAQAAMQFVGAIKELEGIADAFKNFKTVVVDVFKSISTAITATGVGAILVGIGVAIAAIVAYWDDIKAMFDDSSEKAAESLKQIDENSKAIQSRYDNEIKLAKAAGKETIQLELDKLKANEDSIKKQIKIYEDLIAKKGELNDEEKKNYDALQSNLVKATTDRAAKEIEIEREKNKQLQEYNNAREDASTRLVVAKMSDKNKELYELEQKRQEELKKLGTLQNVDNRNEYEQYQKTLKDIDEYYAIERSKINKKYAKEKKINYDNDIQSIQETTVTQNQIIEDGLKFSNDVDAFWKAKMDERDAYYAQKKAERQQRNKEFAINATLETLTVIQELTSAFAGKSEAAQKRAFNINKAAQIAEATISTILAAQKAFTSQVVAGDPTSPIRGAIAAALAVAAGVARVKKIASTQFEGGGGAGGGMADAGAGAGGAMSAPIQNGVNNTSTNLSNLAQGQQEQKPIKAYVLQTDVASEDQKMKAIENKAKIE